MEGSWLALKPSSVPIRDACCDGWQVCRAQDGAAFPVIFTLHFIIKWCCRACKWRK